MNQLTQWETVDSIPTSMKGRAHMLILEPGQIIRRVAKGTGGPQAWLKGKPADYHGARRTVAGVAYHYIWRDPLPEGALQ